MKTPLVLCALVLLATLAAPCGLAQQDPAARESLEAVPDFQGVQVALSPELRERMARWSWGPNCPVGLDDLRLLTLSFWGYDGLPHQGELVVHKDVADEVLGVFQELFQSRFPIERMRLIEEYRGDDNASMADNNTSAFNCRRAPDSSAMSRHSWGLAVDVNPLVNPYVRGELVLPEAGAAFQDRSLDAPGMIRAGDVCVRAFAARGWEWGGEWTGSKDHQHFQKPR